MALTISQPSPASVQSGTAGTITLTVDPAGRVGGASTAIALGVTGGTAPYTWSLVSGALPPGMTFGQDGHLGGIPTARGTALVVVRATDSALPPSFADASLTVVVA